MLLFSFFCWVLIGHLVNRFFFKIFRSEEGKKKKKITKKKIFLFHLKHIWIGGKKKIV